jgi:hypothetical protein
MALTTYLHLAPRLKKELSYTYIPLWPFVGELYLTSLCSFLYSPVTSSLLGTAHIPTSHLVHLYTFPFSSRKNTHSSAVWYMISLASVCYGESKSQNTFCARTSSSK